MKGKTNDRGHSHGGANGSEGSVHHTPYASEVLVVSADPDQRATLSARLESLRLKVHSCAEPTAALSWLARREPPQLVVLDAGLAREQIRLFCQTLRASRPATEQSAPIALALRIGSTQVAQTIVQGLGANAFIPLSSDPQTFESAVRAALHGTPWPPPPGVLIACANEIELTLLKQAIPQAYWRLETAKTSAETIDLAAACQPGWVILDAEWPETQNGSLLMSLAAVTPAVRVLILGGSPDRDNPRWSQASSPARLPRPLQAAAIATFFEQARREQSAYEMLDLLSGQAETLSRQEIRYRTLSAVIADGYALFETCPHQPGMPPDYRCLEINPEGETLTGFSRKQIVGRTLQELIREGFHPLSAVFEEAENTGQTIPYERYLPKTSRHLKGKVFCPQAGRFAIAFIDITAQKQAEARYLRAQRMECIGSLTSGVAHDLNNVLAAIAMAATMLKDNPQGPDVPTLLKTIGASATRGVAIVKQLLTFGRGTEVERLEIQPRLVLEEIAQLARDTFPRDIDVTCEYPRDLWNIQANATQIHQVLLNLCINARDAMPNGGRIAIQAVNQKLDRAFTARHAGVEPGAFVALKIRDSGTGMPPEIAAKIFDPYFTTKEPGKGTGLGLPTVLDIVKSHRGCLKVDTQPGQGTEFTVFFPALDPAAATEAKAARAIFKEEQTALVVESDPNARDFLRQTLENHGYRVLVSRDGSHALALHERHQGEIRIVLTDLTTLSLGQETVARVIRNHNSSVPIVVMGASPGYENAAKKMGLHPRGFLRKPIQSDEVDKVLRELPAP